MGGLTFWLLIPATITTNLPANMLLLDWSVRWRNSRCRKLWMKLQTCCERERNNWTRKRSEWISITGNRQGNTEVCRRWQNDQWGNVGGSCGEMHSFYRQVCVGWWLPVLILLYTLVCKPPLTSGVIFSKTCLQIHVYATALMWNCTLLSLL